MKLKEAISKIYWYCEDISAVGNVRFMSSDEFCALKVIFAQANATRWRKLSEEKPTEEGYYLTWRPKIEDLCAEASVSWWSQDVDEYGWTGFDDPHITHYKPRPIVGPEDEA